MTEQTTKPLAAIAPGEYLYLPNRSADVCEVRHVHTWHADGHHLAAITVVSLATDAADTLHGRADQELTLATAEQVTAAIEAGTRHRAVAQLREIADLIERHQIRIADTWGTPELRLEVADGEVDRIAALIGVGTGEYGRRRRAVWPGPDRSVVVSAEFVGAPALAPVDAPEVVPAEPGSDADQIISAVRHPEGTSIPHSCTAAGCGICNPFPAQTGE